MYGKLQGALDNPQELNGEKFDIIISPLNTNISSIEWKANHVSRNVSIKQESKNVRVSTEILDALCCLNDSNNIM